MNLPTSPATTAPPAGHPNGNGPSSFPRPEPTPGAPGGLEALTPLGGGVRAERVRRPKRREKRLLVILGVATAVLVLAAVAVATWFALGGFRTARADLITHRVTAGPLTMTVVERGTLEGGGYGVVAGAGATVTLRQGVIRRHLDAAGARAPGGRVALEGVRVEANARDEIVDDATLPEAAFVPPPDPVCPEEGCL